MTLKRGPLVTSGLAEVVGAGWSGEAAMIIECKRWRRPIGWFTDVMAGVSQRDSPES
jgi:hypothetical protein